MFIRLTRIDGQAVWFNSSYIVTVEPRKGSGSLVVPLGDGIDYEVREQAEKIVEAMGGEFAPDNRQRKSQPSQMTPPVGSRGVADVRVEEAADMPEFRISKSAAPIPFELRNVPTEVASAGQAKKPTRRKRTVTKGEVAEGDPETASTVGGEAAPKRKTARKTTARKPKLPPLPLSDEQLIRLQKMAPGSAKKLSNTLKSQFAVDDTDSAIVSLQANGLIVIADDGHVSWQWRML